MPDKLTQDAAARRGPVAKGPREEFPIGSFLLKLFKAMKGAQFYPENHPAFDALLEKCYGELLPIVGKQPALSFETRNQRIQIDGKPVLPEMTETRRLAMECLYRRLKKFQIQAGVEKWELAGFLRMMITDPAVVQAAGGVEKVLFAKGIRNIWANEINYQDLLYGEQPNEASEDIFGPEEGAEPVDPIEEAPLTLPSDATPLQEELVKILRALDAATDARAYGELAASLLDLVRRSDPPLDHEDVYRAMRVLSAHVDGRDDHDPEIVPCASSTLRTLATPEVTLFLARRLIKRTHASAPRLITLFWQIGPTSLPVLIDLLAEAKVMRARRILADTIAGFGDAATPLLLKSLDDERWFVVRNTVGILGEIASPTAITALEPLSAHHDPRIVKEVIKALGKIGGPDARRIVQHYLKRGTKDLRVLAAFALGVMREPEAVPALLSMLPRRAAFTNFELQREVIKALAKIGSSAAVPALARILRRRSLFARRTSEDLRVIATQALARLNTEEARVLLARGVRSPNPRVAEICRAAIQEEDVS